MQLTVQLTARLADCWPVVERRIVGRATACRNEMTGLSGLVPFDDGYFVQHDFERQEFERLEFALLV